MCFHSFVDLSVWDSKLTEMFRPINYWHCAQKPSASPSYDQHFVSSTHLTKCKRHNIRAMLMRRKLLIRQSLQIIQSTAHLEYFRNACLKFFVYNRELLHLRKWVSHDNKPLIHQYIVEIVCSCPWVWTMYQHMRLNLIHT